MKKSLIYFGIFILFATFNNAVWAQRNAKFTIQKGKPNTYQIWSNLNQKIIVKNCLKIDSITNLNYPTNERYQNYWLVKQKKHLIIINHQTGSINNFLCKGDFQIKELFHRNEFNSDTLPYKRPLLQIITPNKVLFLNVEEDKIFTAENEMSDAWYISKWELIRLITSSLQRGGFKSKIIDLQGNAITKEYYQNSLIEVDTGFIVRDFYPPESFNLGYGIIDKKGKMILPYTYKEIKPTVNGYLIAMNDKNKIGILDKRLNIVIPFEHHSVMGEIYNYRSVLSSSEGVFGLYTDDSLQKIVFYDTTGKTIVSSGTYDLVEYLDSPWNLITRYWKVSLKDNDKYAIYDTKKQAEIFPMEYRFSKKHFELRKNLMGAVKNEKYGVLDLENQKELIPFIYDKDYHHFENRSNNTEYFILKKNGLKGILSTQGEELLPFDYDQISPDYYDNYWIIKRNGLYGLLDANSLTTILPTQYKTITKHLHLELKENGAIKKGTFTKKGIIWD